MDKQRAEPSPEKKNSWTIAANFAFKHLDAMRHLMDRANGLNEKEKGSGERPWGNTIEHCWGEAMVGSALFRQLRLTPEKQDSLINFLLIHDALQRVERDGNFTDETAKEQARQDMRSYLNTIDPDGALMKSTNAAFAQEGHEKKATDEQRLVHFLDDSFMGDACTYPAVRLEEVRTRRPDITEKYGEKFWMEELAAAQRDAGRICELLANQGIHVTPARLPSFIIRKMCEERGIRPSGMDQWPGDLGKEMLGTHFYAQMLTDTYRNPPTKNEDRHFCKFIGNRAKMGVFDGGTVIKDPPEFLKTLPLSPGAYAAQVDKETLAGRSGYDLSGDPLEDLLACNAALRTKIAAMPISDEDKKSLLTSVGMIVNVERKKDGSIELKYASVGDCALITLDAENKATWHAIGKGEHIEAQEFDEAYLDVQKLRKEGKDATMAEIFLQLEKYPRAMAAMDWSRNLENHPSGEGHGALKGSSDEDMMRYVQHGTVVFHNPTEIKSVILITDGPLPPVSMPMEERKKFVEDALKSGGLKALLAARKKLAEDNRDCEHPLCMKPRDDETAIELKIL